MNYFSHAVNTANVDTALLLATGTGTRLQPLTLDAPKCLTEVGGIPILERLVNNLRAQGFKRLIVVIGHLVDRNISKMDNYLDGNWEKFERWIRNTIGPDFCRRVRPMDKRSSREMIVDLVQNDINKEHKGLSPRMSLY